MGRKDNIIPDYAGNFSPWGGPSTGYGFFLFGSVVIHPGWIRIRVVQNPLIAMPGSSLPGMPAAGWIVVTLRLGKSRKFWRMAGSICRRANRMAARIPDGPWRGI